MRFTNWIKRHPWDILTFFALIGSIVLVAFDLQAATWLMGLAVWLRLEAMDD